MNNELQDLAEYGFRAAKRAMRKDLGFNPVFILRLPDGQLKDLGLSEELAPFMDDGCAKDAIFGALRMTVQATHATACIVVTECWVGGPTESGKLLPRQEWERLTEKHSIPELARMGYVERSEALVINVQTSTETLLRTYYFARRSHPDRIIWGETRDIQGSEFEFSGRQKMFGDLREENLQ